MLRRIRGVLGTALTWSAAWAAFGLARLAWFDGWSILSTMHRQPRFIVLQVSGWAVLGAIGGAAFAARSDAVEVPVARS
ncbi:MAG TPA: hypothetical protein VMH39_01280 [Gemmatimonadaceae bacterium]|nr:hypothetical protein [Gemmatimonadaceae bacterium]